MEGGFIYPDGPTDASKLIGDSAGRFVVTDTLFELCCPLL